LFLVAKILCISATLTVADYAIAIPRNRGIAIGRVVGDLRVEMRDLRIELPGHFKSPVVSA
jgi:hypothetical protein